MVYSGIMYRNVAKIKILRIVVYSYVRQQALFIIPFSVIRRQKKTKKQIIIQK